MRPINIDLQDQMNNYKGNFGLYFNKFIEINDSNGNPNRNAPAVPCHVTRLEKIYSNITSGPVDNLLKNKHDSQASYLKYMSSFGFKTHEVILILQSNMILGIGEVNPGEVGMVFDRTIGIPYIPASSIKGIVRFTHLCELVKNGISEDKIKKDNKGNLYFDDTEEWTEVIKYFGGTNKEASFSGKVIFMDAYPESKPKLHIDIMNPHYGDYYQDDSGRTPPADYLMPCPIKFLTVKKGTKFVFRVMVKDIELETHAKDILLKALTEHGIGAKTAVGYGVFGDKQSIDRASSSHIVNAEPDHLMKVNGEMNVKISKINDYGVEVKDEISGFKSNLNNNQLENWVKNAKKIGLEIKVLVTEVTPNKMRFKCTNKIK